MKKVFLTVFGLSVLLLSGCVGVDNNYLRPNDFALKMKRDGLPVGAVKPLNPIPIGASEALEVQVGNSNIGIYKFDRSVKQFKQRLERIAETKRIYFNCIPYPIYEVHGSFFIVGLDKNTYKHRILESLRNFN